MQFKQLELKQEGNRLKRFVRNPHTRRTLIATLIGALVGFLLFYFSEGRYMESLGSGEILKSLMIGGFFGFFVTNSPCARGRC